MPEAELEQAYDLIAEAIDRAGREQEAGFLARLCLALSAQLENVSQVKAAIDAAGKGTTPVNREPKKKGGHDA